MQKTLNFGGFVPLSTVDFPGYSCCTVFFRGCSLRCGYCHNKHLWEGNSPVDISLVKDAIFGSKKFISGVAFSGGEPMEQPEALLELLTFCKDNGLKTCVHTNGLHDIAFLEKIDLLLLGVKAETKQFNHPNIVRIEVKDASEKT